MQAQRRKVLTAGLALPAALVARKASAHYCYDLDVDLTCGGAAPWIGDPWQEWYAAINGFNMAVGSAPFPPNTRAISGLDDPWFRAQLQPGEYAGLGELADLVQLGMWGGGAWGLRRGSTRASVVGAALGGGFMAAMWLGYNGGVLLNRLNPPWPGAPGGPVNYNGGYYQHSTPPGSYGGIGAGAWVVIYINPQDGSGNSLTTRMQ